MYNVLKNKIQRIAEKNPAGFTYKLKQEVLATKGYVVACAETQDCFGKSGLYQVIKICKRHVNCCIGGWRNEDGAMQYDASVVYYNIEDAIKAAIENNQRAFFNLYTGCEIMASEYADYLEKVSA